MKTVLSLVALAAFGAVCVLGAAPDAAWMKACLDQHNVFRANHSAPNLALNSTLSAYAQKWADQLASTNTFQHSQGAYGENLYAHSSTAVKGQDPVYMWYDEQKAYTDYANPNLNNFAKWGHFTQVVWKGTTQAGFGMARGKTMTYVVGSYSPPGNMFTVPAFAANVVKPKHA